MAEKDEGYGGASVAAPLFGFLIAESEAELRVQVVGGTWIVRPEDAEVTAWDTPVGTGEGRPVELRVRSGASVQYLQTLQVLAAGRPMTIPEKMVEAIGQEEVDAMARSWAVSLALDLKTLGADDRTYSYEMTCENGSCHDGYAIDSLD